MRSIGPRGPKRTPETMQLIADEAMAFIKSRNGVKAGELKQFGKLRPSPKVFLERFGHNPKVEQNGKQYVYRG